VNAITSPISISYEFEVEEIKSEYNGAVKIKGKEADWQKRRDYEQAGLNWQDESPENRLKQIRTLRSSEARHFEMEVTKYEARGFGIGSRLRVTISNIEPLAEAEAHG
jgi:hypothetical protein